MSNAIFLHAELRLAAQGKAGSPDNGDKAITGIAYSGDAVVQWGERFVVDLETLASATPLPILFEHGRAGTIGVIDAIGNDGRRMTIEEGRIFAGMESDLLPRQIAEKAARGFPYELSIGIYDGSREDFPAGKTVTVNGRRFTGPVAVIRNAVLREVSVVALGADPNTRAEVAARAQLQPHQEGDPMTEPKKESMGADSGAEGAAPEELAARIAELEASLSAERERADQAERALAEHRQAARLEAVKALLAELGIEYSEQAAAPYLELTDEAFRAMAEQVRATLESSRKGGGHDGGLFADVGEADPAGQGHSGSLSLSITEIYAKRRTE